MANTVIGFLYLKKLIQVRIRFSSSKCNGQQIWRNKLSTLSNREGIQGQEVNTVGVQFPRCDGVGIDGKSVNRSSAESLSLSLSLSLFRTVAVSRGLSTLEWCTEYRLSVDRDWEGQRDVCAVYIYYIRQVQLTNSLLRVCRSIGRY